jgi:hypothetical protein
MDPLTAVTAFVPALLDVGKALTQRFLAPKEMKPMNVDEYVRMRETDLAMFKAMNDTTAGGGSYPWVDAIVRLQRPLVGAIVLGVWAYTVATGKQSESVDNFASAIGFYLFGDRTLFYAKKSK